MTIELKHELCFRQKLKKSHKLRLILFFNETATRLPSLDMDNDFIFIAMICQVCCLHQRQRVELTLELTVAKSFSFSFLT